jgi:hypothetical protein
MAVSLQSAAPAGGVALAAKARNPRAARAAALVRSLIFFPMYNLFRRIVPAGIALV